MPEMQSTAHVLDLLVDGAWELARTAPGACTSPADLDDGLVWMPARVPGTVASSLLDGPVTGLQADPGYGQHDWWYRIVLPARAPAADTPLHLAAEGLATLAEVWLDDTLLLRSDNMFLRHSLHIGMPSAGAVLYLAFRAEEGFLAKKRPRPRWRTALVTAQGLRALRTTLLGRIPAWTPPLPPIGPWRPVRLELPAPVLVTEHQLRADVDGSDGQVCFRADLLLKNGESIASARLQVGVEGVELAVRAVDGGMRLQGICQVPDVRRWWPHTHGEPALYDWALSVVVAGVRHRVLGGRLGFRDIVLDRTDGAVELQVNGVPVFCRGACWTAADVVGLTEAPDRLRAVLEHARDAGLNMIRIGGTMTYATAVFHALCDELGLMVWQDFMFANMDYPLDDPALRESAEAEVRQQLMRLAGHASTAVYCGNSEVEQQAAMRGVPRESWRHDFFATGLPALCEALHPGVPYVPSTPSEGALPFHTHTGFAHYFGVGAYKRGLEDLDAARVRFAPECLGFSNIPSDAAVLRHFSTPAPQTHHPAWKAGVPRDAAAGWDFEDIRDHYMQQLFGVDPVALRYYDTERYLQLGRIVTGELMARSFSYWRWASSGCGGALVWTLLDLVPGAGWGLVDVDGDPKPALQLLAGYLRPVQLLLVDRGLNGHALGLINETAGIVRGRLQLELRQARGAPLAAVERDVELAPRSNRTEDVDSLLGGFLDTTGSYRFGPAAHCALVATLRGDGGELLSQVVLPTRRAEPEMLHGVSVAARIQRQGDEEQLCLCSDSLLMYVAIELPGRAPADNFLWLLPGQEYRVPLRRTGGRIGSGQFTALNTRQVFRIEAGDEH